MVLEERLKNRSKETDIELQRPQTFSGHHGCCGLLVKIRLEIIDCLVAVVDMVGILLLDRIDYTRRSPVFEPILWF